MAYTLPPLPYATDALEPHISKQTIELHHGKHHKTYVTKLNELTEGEGDNSQLDRVVREADGALLDNAGQHWNHTFFWQCLSPDGGQPNGALAEAIDSTFGSLDTFRKELAEEAAAHFGSGWAWLVHDGSGLAIRTTHDADNPLRHGCQPLLTIDVWEHAYYLDYQNKRPDYLAHVLEHLVAWDFVAQRFEAAG
jgi:Fe-Mn family superoxide dismutase